MVTMGQVGAAICEATEELRLESAELARRAQESLGIEEIQSRFGPLLRAAAVVTERLETAQSNWIAFMQAAETDLDSEDPTTSMAKALSDCSLELAEALGAVSITLGLPVAQWRMQIALAKTERNDWPSLWRVAVRLGEVWHLVDDLYELRRALLQLASTVVTDDAHPWAVATLARWGITREFIQRRSSEDVGRICADKLNAFVIESRRRASTSIAIAEATTAARFLEAQDLYHLGVHSQNRRCGGAFLSHRGREFKSALMNGFAGAREFVFLDIWARPIWDTNRRFLWRNLSACANFYAFITPLYTASQWCMKEIEAWELVAAARADELAPGYAQAFHIEGLASEEAVKIPREARWLGLLAQRDPPSCPPFEAINASVGAVVHAKTTPGESLVTSDRRIRNSDAFNRASLRSHLYKGAAQHALWLGRETTGSLLILWRDVVNRLKDHIAAMSEDACGSDILQLVEFAEQQFHGRAPASNAQLARFVVEFEKRWGELTRSLSGHVDSGDYSRRICCICRIVRVASTIASWLTRDLASDDPATADKALFYYAKFGASLDNVRSELDNWAGALVEARFDQLPSPILEPGLVLALLPVDHELPVSEIRLAADRVGIDPHNDSVSMIAELAALGLQCRKLFIICSAFPHPWQQIATVAALSSFVHRIYFFVDIAGSGSLRATVGSVAMEEFPHITVSSALDLGPVERTSSNMKD